MAGRDSLSLEQAFALGALAGQFARAADRLGLFAGPAFRWLLVKISQLHFAKHAFALHLLLQRAKRLVDIVVANQNLHSRSFS